MLTLEADSFDATGQVRHHSEMTDSLTFVFDTNVVVDWLVFDAAYLDPLRQAVAEGRVVVIANALARDELRRVLGYSLLKLNSDRQAAVLDRYDAQTRPFALRAEFSRINLLLPAMFPRCRDEDDDLFLALAWHARAHLVTRDRALLKLRKRVRRFDLTILDVQQMVATVTGQRA